MTPEHRALIEEAYRNVVCRTVWRGRILSVPILSPMTLRPFEPDERSMAISHDVLNFKRSAINIDGHTHHVLTCDGLLFTDPRPQDAQT